MRNEIDHVEAIDATADHSGAEAHLCALGWTVCGRGDWAIALRSPSKQLAARISPFDPTAAFTADLYRAGRHTGWFPTLFLERSLAGGANLLLMEFLHPADPAVGMEVHRRRREKDPGIKNAADLIEQVHADASRTLPWCGPIDDNPANITTSADGSPRITDPYYAAGPALYGAILDAPLEVARTIPAAQRQHILEIPMDSTGRWEQQQVAKMRDNLARADAALGHDRTIGT
ncbi:hypothetical protein [Herbiconiux sp. L3-i23]|uniref:hypothetical protein n=1 Tax=Herbiconiux sp. L3-i23 TaxID=2905871 RepID=UPI00205F6F4C|nr:hypothetical protein [Herbiconiux sp. L3-i23]BDI22996.1 hypothetical protein L3i23_17720 [Herbiconiux sp. L3-i23]